MTTDSVFYSKIVRKREKIVSVIVISLLEMLTFCAKASFYETFWKIFKNIIHESKDILKIYIIRMSIISQEKNIFFFHK